MTGWDDLPDEMRGERIDDGTLDRLLRGHLPPDDAPPGYSEVASVLLAAASRPTTQELRLQELHVPAARDAVTRRSPRRRGPLGFVVGALVVAALAVVPGLAVANVFQHPSNPAPAPTSTGEADTSDAPSAEPRDEPSGVHPASTGSEISTIATTTDATGVAKGAEISTVASGGKSQAGQHGQASEAPAGPPESPGSHAPTTHGAAGAEHASASARGAQAHA